MVPPETAKRRMLPFGAALRQPCAMLGAFSQWLEEPEQAPEISQICQQLHTHIFCECRVEAPPVVLRVFGGGPRGPCYYRGIVLKLPRI
eukprot:10222239-Alexandrium_andersonii.AAC.1